MADKLPMISGVHFEQMPERLKIVLPAARKWGYLAVYSLLVVAWLVMMLGGLIFIVRILASGAGYRWVFTIMILILLAILFRFGRFLWRQWAAFASNREVLLVNPEELIVRRPVSIWGNTDAYDMAHVSPFYESANPQALAFDYGYRHVYVGEALTSEARQALAQFLNQQYLPGRARAGGVAVN
jgi:MFS family permease